MADGIPIREISSSAFVQARLRELDVNHDEALTSDEVPVEPLTGELGVSAVTKPWSSEAWRFTEHALLAKDLLGRVRLILPQRTVADSVTITDVEGDARVGSVTHVRQIHHMDKGDEPESIEVQIDVCQYRVLRELVALKVRDVFLESVEQPFTGHSWHKLGYFKLVQAIKKDFAVAQLGEQPTVAQRAWLRRLRPLKVPGALLYALINPHVVIRPTQTRAIRDKADRLIAQGTYRELVTHRAFVMMEREQVAVLQVTNFLRRHRGARVVLVFGADHEFRGHFAEQRQRPQFRSIDFPALKHAVLSAFEKFHRR